MTADEVVQALAPLTTALNADGYDLLADLGAQEDGAPLMIRVVATADACEDCLVPRDLFRDMVADQLRSAGLEPPAIVVAYPADTS